MLTTKPTHVPQPVRETPPAPIPQEVDNIWAALEELTRSIDRLAAALTPVSCTAPVEYAPIPGVPRDGSSPLLGRLLDIEAAINDLRRRTDQAKDCLEI
jgi:hypothetical protein